MPSLLAEGQQEGLAEGTFVPFTSDVLTPSRRLIGSVTQDGRDTDVENPRNAGNPLPQRTPKLRTYDFTETAATRIDDTSDKTPKGLPSQSPGNPLCTLASVRVRS
jgi:hypothetical protein